jgi:intracellular sulfur oxidation DsrE/DsrF family protein
MKLALNNSRNAFELYKARGEEVATEIVAYSQGLHMLRDDTSPVKNEIRELRKLVPQVAFEACNNTKNAMEKREGKPVPIIAEATIVPAGVVRLVELQEVGLRLHQAVASAAMVRDARLRFIEGSSPEGAVIKLLAKDNLMFSIYYLLLDWRL